MKDTVPTVTEDALQQLIHEWLWCDCCTGDNCEGKLNGHALCTLVGLLATYPPGHMRDRMVYGIWCEEEL